MRRWITVTPPEEQSNESTALVAAPSPKALATTWNKGSGRAFERDLALAEIEKAKKLSFIIAWEESEKTKADNKAQKKISTISSWENRKKAAKEADLRKTEEQLEKKKAGYGEKVKNKVALIHRQAEIKRAIIQAKHSEEILKAEEMATKYRATGYMPKKFLGCF